MLILFTSGAAISIDATNHFKFQNSIYVGNLQQQNTIAGVLKITEIEKFKFLIDLDGRITRYEDEAINVSVVTKIPNAGKPEIILIKVESGGISCPAKYFIVDVTVKNHPIATNNFGNCSDNPMIYTRGLDIEISFPPYKEMASYQYKYISKLKRLMMSADPSRKSDIGASLYTIMQKYILDPTS